MLIPREVINEITNKEINNLLKDVDKNPTQGQKEAGNYKMGHINVLGFDITIENPRGSYRKGVDKDGKEWKCKMYHHYGYFRRTKAIDGDAIDVFVGKNLKSDKIFVVDQVNNKGEFDESKVMLGFDTAKEAKEGYLSCYSKDWKGFKEITEVDIETFRKWLYNGTKRIKPFAEYKLNECIRQICTKQLNELIKGS